MRVRQHGRVERARGPATGTPRRVENGLLAAQRAVGNRAVQRLLTGGGHPATAAGPTLLQAVATVQRHPAPAAAPAPAPVDDLLADSRIAWIETLPVAKRATIDSLDPKLTSHIRKIEDKLAKAGQTGDAAATEAARTELDTIKRKNSTAWFTRRIAFMDYMGCTLGGDAGVRRYWEALTTWGDEWGFVVHPEVARRLDRVKADLAAQGVPMPQTTVGQSLRGDHTRNERERKSPGMMSHAMGVAADWFAYKNVHLTDERLMRVISAVTGGPHHMRLPKGGLSTIVAMGEAAMGTGTVDPAKSQEVLDAIGAEFDRLQAASDRLTTSLSTPKEEVLALHGALAPLVETAEKAKEAWQKERRVAQKAEKKAAFDAAQAALDAEEAELKPRLEALFKPWIDALDRKAKEIEKAAADRGVRLDEVTTGQTLDAKRKALVASAVPAKKALAKVVTAAKGAGTRAAGVRGAAAGAVAYLAGGAAPRGATADQLAAWPGTVGGLVQRATEAITGASRLKEEAELLSGAAPSALGTGKDGRPAFRGQRDIDGWTGALDKAEESVRAAAKDLESAAAALPPGQRDAAQELARLVASNEAVAARAGIGKAGLAQLQEQKKELYWVQQAAKDLLADASFMFTGPSVKNPGVAQLLGHMDERYGGGGFFGTTAVGRRNPRSDEAGFDKLFFQTMAKYGFEPAASWHTADTMHFEVEALVQSIVPPDHCEEPPSDAEDTAKADPKLTGAALEKRLKAIADQREKVRRGAVNAAAYVDSAERSRTALDAER